MLLFQVLLSFTAFCHATLQSDAARVQRSLFSQYAPSSSAACPGSPLIRQATGLSTGEAQYISQRKPIADAALASWLKKVNTGFDTSALPQIALAGSGGGYRALLDEAGILQAFDSRDSKSSVNGLYQAFSYHTALSGGGWFAASLAAWDWPTVSYLQKKVYEPDFQQGLLFPNGIGFLPAYLEIVADVEAKAAAGYPVTPGDIYARLLGYNLFPAPDGGATLTTSGLTTFTNFTTHQVPYPILTSIGTNASSEGNCSSPPDATQYEYTPHEFGSWDRGVDSFVQITHLGSSLDNGTFAHGECTTGFDRLDFVTASTSNIFGFFCSPLYNGQAQVLQVINTIQSAFFMAIGTLSTELFNVIPNPFYHYAHASAVTNASLLTLGDGDLSLQNDPLWPLIQPERDNVSAIIVADVCNENATNSPCDGTSLHNTYIQAQAQGLPRMPSIPPPTTFTAQDLASQARFFGCNQPSAVTLVWLPMINYSSNAANEVSTSDTQVSKANTKAIINNGNLIATQNNDPKWPTCLACAMLKKSSQTLPPACEACFTRYCVS